MMVEFILTCTLYWFIRLHSVVSICTICVANSVDFDQTFNRIFIRIYTVCHSSESAV